MEEELNITFLDSGEVVGYLVEEAQSQLSPVSCRTEHRILRWLELGCKNHEGLRYHVLFEEIVKDPTSSNIS